MNAKKLFFFFIIIIFCLIGLNQALAYSFTDISGFSSSTANEAGLTQTDYAQIVANTIKAMLTIVGALFVILFIYAGFTWLTSSGNEEKINKAKKTIMYAVVGAFIVTAAYSITSFIATSIPGQSVVPTNTNTPGTNTAGGADCTTQGGSCMTSNQCDTLHATSLGFMDCGANICCNTSLIPPGTPGYNAAACSSMGGLCATYYDCQNAYQGTPITLCGGQISADQGCGSNICCINVPTTRQECAKCGHQSQGICDSAECKALGNNCEFHGAGFYCTFAPSSTPNCQAPR